MAAIPTYIDVISEFHPDVQVQASGDGRDYSKLVALTVFPIPPKETLDAEIQELLRTRIWREIQAIRDERKAGGVKVGDNWFHSDDTSRIQQIALTMLGANMPKGIMWKTMQGTFVEMTATLATQIFQSIVAKDQALFAKAEQHRAAMVASQDPTTYDYTTGWPQTYAEASYVAPPPAQPL